MYKFSIYVLAFFICQAALHAQPIDTINYSAPGEIIYKHYTGTIGNKKAAIDLRYGFQAASNFGGSSCYFLDEGGLDFFLIAKPPSQSHKEVLRAQVFPENIPLTEVKNAYSIFVQTPRFEFTLSHDSLLGKWINPNTQELPQMTFTEDKSGSFHAEYAHATDSASATGKKGENERAKMIYNGIKLTESMRGKERTFVSTAFAHFLGLEAGAGKDKADLSQICAEKFFSDFRAAVSSGKETGGSNFAAEYTLFPVFREKEFLVFQLAGYHYDFDTREYTDRNTYLCLDLRNRKTLQLGDILVPGSDGLAAILESAFRSKYQIDPSKKLSDFFTSEKMPTTDNFILLNTGLIFSYSPAKVFRDDQDISDMQEMRIFVPYDKLAAMLKPEFKERIGLK